MDALTEIMDLKKVHKYLLNSLSFASISNLLKAENDSFIQDILVAAPWTLHLRAVTPIAPPPLSPTPC
jgi:hypothetical protein